MRIVMPHAIDLDRKSTVVDDLDFGGIERPNNPTAQRAFDITNGMRYFFASVPNSINPRLDKRAPCATTLD